MKTKPDVLIIGAGPAGSTAAALLARAGFEAMVVEKSIFPRFTIGESLLPQCMDLLAEADLLDAVHARNYQIKEGGLFRQRDQVAEFDFSQQFTDGWTYTYQVPRDDFDNVLASAAQARGASVHFGMGVTTVRFGAERAEVEIEGPDETRTTIFPRFVLDASGGARVLPRLLNLSKPTGLRLRSSIFSHVTGDQGDPMVGRKKILIAIHPQQRDVWYWVIPFASGATSIGVVAEPDFLARQAGDTEQQFRALLKQEPNVAARLQDEALLYPPRAVSGYAHAVTQLYGKQFAILGNAAEFLDPVFSSGVTIAMKSASLASAALIRQFHGEPVDWKQDFEAELMRGVNAFRTYVRGWYDGSFQDVIFSRHKDDACVDKICSILAGYVWDRDNPLAVKHERGLQSIVELCALSASS
ncbi:MAG: NAD(P)/FAD-dependent oxidoreductase [Verrucomicrobia bacterium]|nr:NAD(P)/FAD-dependent oxidoreductase [Verrucomicrobiota bacterium]